MKGRGTIVFDFDGVIHSYTSGWQGVDNVPDPPLKLGVELAKELKDLGYNLVICSSRATTDAGKMAIEKWLSDNNLSELFTEVTCIKVPALCYIDDRAVPFNGTDCRLQNSYLDKYLPFGYTPNFKWKSVKLNWKIGNYNDSLRQFKDTQKDLYQTIVALVGEGIDVNIPYKDGRITRIYPNGVSNSWVIELVGLTEPRQVISTLEMAQIIQDNFCK